jgi:hypothetical protein
MTSQLQLAGQQGREQQGSQSQRELEEQLISPDVRSSHVVVKLSLCLASNQMVGSLTQEPHQAQSLLLIQHASSRMFASADKRKRKRGRVQRRCASSIVC